MILVMWYDRMRWKMKMNPPNGELEIASPPGDRLGDSRNVPQ
jgi:hypothetical protein